MSFPVTMRAVTRDHLGALFGCLAVFNNPGCESSLFFEIEPGKTIEATITKEGTRAIRVVVIGAGIAYMSPYQPANDDAELGAFLRQLAEAETP